MAFLVSPAARWMTGTQLRIDGGEEKSIESRGRLAIGLRKKAAARTNTASGTSVKNQSWIT
jgi:hypothetical protein